MSKYIIDTGDYLFTTDGVLVVGFDCDNKPATFYNSLDTLEELNSDYINENYGELQDAAYQKGINDGSLDVKQRVEGAYQRGLEDAWEAAKRIVCDEKLDWNTLLHLFNRSNFTGIFGDFSASEAIEKLKAYEENKDEPIKAGDIVDRYIDGKFDSRGIYLEEDDGYWRCLYNTGAILTTLAYPKEQFKKTGKHYDVQSILEAMRK